VYHAASVQVYYAERLQVHDVALSQVHCVELMQVNYVNQLISLILYLESDRGILQLDWRSAAPSGFHLGNAIDLRSLGFTSGTTNLSRTQLTSGAKAILPLVTTTGREHHQAAPDPVPLTMPPQEMTCEPAKMISPLAMPPDSTVSVPPEICAPSSVPPALTVSEPQLVLIALRGAVKCCAARIQCANVQPEAR
jgi:hypothetical protein